jgi:propanol-preferring alcohol dehydrogenase
MVTKMKAGVVHKFGQPLTIEEIVVPEPGEGEVLVKIEASGVCHTDLHAADGDWPVKPTLPCTHEGSKVPCIASFIGEEDAFFDLDQQLG